MCEYKKIPYNQIEVGEVLGEGAFADVYRATLQDTPVALKRLKNTKGFKEFRTEVKFMRYCPFSAFSLSSYYERLLTSLR